MPPAEPKVDGRSLRYQGRREELLRAVTRYVLDNGIGDLAMRPLAEAVGVSHVTLLNHFGTKEQLITEVVERLAARTFPKAEALEIPDGVVIDGAEILSMWWDAWSKPEFEPGMRLMFEVYGRALQDPERYGTFFTEVFGAWDKIFRSFVVAAGCPEGEIDQTVTVLLALMRGLQMDLVATGDHARINQAHAFFVEIVREKQARWGEPA